MLSKYYFVYMMTNPLNRVIYVGVTNNLLRRVFQHKEKRIEGFTKKYNVTKLVYYEETQDVVSAIEREKQLKAGSRQKKIDLINLTNPEWRDLYGSLY